MSANYPFTKNTKLISICFDAIPFIHISIFCPCWSLWVDANKKIKAPFQQESRLSFSELFVLSAQQQHRVSGMMQKLPFLILRKLKSKSNTQIRFLCEMRHILDIMFGDMRVSDLLSKEVCLACPESPDFLSSHILFCQNLREYVVFDKKAQWPFRWQVLLQLPRQPCFQWNIFMGTFKDGTRMYVECIEQA